MSAEDPIATAERRLRGRPRKGAGGQEGREKWTVRIAPLMRARIEAEAARRGVSVADALEGWAETLPVVVL